MSCFGLILLFVIVYVIFGPIGVVILSIILIISSLSKVKQTNISVNGFDQKKGYPSYDPFIDIIKIFSYITLLDSVVSKEEVEYVKSFLISLFPNDTQRVQTLMYYYKEFNESPNRFNLNEAIENINRFAKYEERLSIFSVVVDFSLKSRKSEKVRETLFGIGKRLNLNIYDINSIINYYDKFFSKDIDNRKRWYSILGVSEECSNDEIKRAYRDLVKKTHPDKLRNMPETVVKDAESRIKEINEAYNNIKMERGFS
ncbi:MAG: J domain-containing protein [bacterium]|uniref:Co-chaperone DjlA n=2 Tax=Bacteria candidate phyla TaxID=1783234 RepID=A0A117M6B5_UNCT6|nr:MAG: Co-chaperone DjlA [candidate division TA06 bacterium 32_111]KUK86845.1 MAG: Co-chaperone DjlA [candidate division TA06 bacterium 34_109]MDI6700766.1 J domain-containing protein [bacterium]HAF07316.1 hypothetical protein [candidate division WOR-3 bacterium]HCP16450.1 hypothetical protein [candidate division WOR-3 bacterium]